MASSHPPAQQNLRDLTFRCPTPGDVEAVRELVGAFVPVDARVAEWKGEIAAAAAWRQDEGIAVLDVLTAAPRLRQWDLEPALLDDVLRHLRDEGVRQVEVRVPLTDVPTRGMYEAAGFRELGREKQTVTLEKWLTGRARR